MTFRTILPAAAAAVLLSALAPALLPATASALGAANATAATGSHRPPPGIGSLIAKADKQGPLRVIVETTDMASRSDLRHVLDHARAKYQVRTEFKKFPFLVMQADSTTLKMLSSARGVVRVSEDTLDRPVGGRSHHDWRRGDHHGHRAAPLGATAPATRQDPGDSMRLIGADKVHALGGTGAHQAVVILDTGIDRRHPYLAGRVVAEACYSNPDGAAGRSLCPNGRSSQTGTGAADSTTPACRTPRENLCAHGTHVAGIAAGRHVTGSPPDGVAPGADIIAVQVFTRQNSAALCGDRAPCVLSYLSDQLLGLQKALELSEQYDIAAVNMSLGSDQPETTPCDTDMRKVAIDALLNRHVATVVAAGNESSTGSGVPGCISSAVTVGATDDHDALASFTNRGPLIDLYAPGVDVTSSVPGGDYLELSGTSMSTPHVTGAFAVLRQAEPDATVADLLGVMDRTGEPVAESPGGRPISGAGGDTAAQRAETAPRIDLYAAWQALHAKT